jgi:hypothetical protein
LCPADAAVLYSTRFLEAEDLANNFLFNVSGDDVSAVAV